MRPEKWQAGVTIAFCDHQDQRYDTCGDWYTTEAGHILRIIVSDLGDWRINFLIALHELVEAMLCRNDGVTEKAVDEFDMGGGISEDFVDDPGCDPQAPYHKQHMWADSIERLVGLMMNVSREDAIKAIMKLPKWEPK